MGLHYTGLAELHTNNKNKKRPKGSEQMHASWQNHHPCHRAAAQVGTQELCKFRGKPTSMGRNVL